MTFRRSVALAYGIAGTATVVLGGENRGFMLKTWDWTETYDKLGVTGTFTIHGAGATPALRSVDIGQNLDAFEYLYAHSGDLTVASDTLREFTATFATSSPTATITDTSGGSFTSADIDRLISVEAIGTWRITAVGGTSCTVRLVPGVTVPADNGATNARVLNNILKTKESSRLRGYHARVSIAPETAENDTKHRMTFSFTIEFEKSAKDSRDDGRRAAMVSTTVDSTGRRSGLVLTGVYTGVSGTNAVAQHAAEYAAWKATVLSDYSSTDFEDLGTSIQFDDEKALMSFTNAFREFRIEESIGAVDKDDTSLSNQNLTLTRRSPASHGVSGLVTPPMVEVTYSTLVSNSLNSDNWRTDIYEAKILPHLFNRIKKSFGSGTIVLLEDLPTFDPASGAISTFLQVQLNLGTTSTLLRYSRVVSMSLSMNKSLRNRWNKKKHSYSSFSPTESIVSQVQVSETRRGPPVFTGQDIIGTNQGGVSGLNFNGDEAYIAPPSPLFPEELVEDFGENEWIFMGANVFSSYGYQGKNANSGQSGIVKENDLVTTTEFVSSWVWGNEVIDEQVTNESSPEVSAELTLDEQLVRGVSEGEAPEDGGAITLSQDLFDF